PEFFGCQHDFVSIHGDFMPGWIEKERPVLIGADLPVIGPLQSAKQGLDSGHKSFGAERLTDIVVGSKFKPDDGIRFLAFGGQHNDRKHRRWRSSSKLLAYFQA